MKTIHTVAHKADAVLQKINVIKTRYDKTEFFRVKRIRKCVISRKAFPMTFFKKHRSVIMQISAEKNCCTCVI